MLNHEKKSVNVFEDIKLYGKMKSIENEKKKEMVKYIIPLKNKVFNGLEQKILLSFPLTIVNYIFSFLTKYNISLYFLIIKVTYKISPFWGCQCYCKRNELFRKKVSNTNRIFYKRCLGCFCELCTYANLSNGSSFNCDKIKDKCNCDKCYYGISKCYMHPYYMN